MSKFKEFTALFILNEEQQERLSKLLPWFREYPGENRDYPFQQWSPEDLMRSLVESEGARIIEERIRYEEWRQGYISFEDMQKKPEGNYR